VATDTRTLWLMAVATLAAVILVIWSFQ
jgi:hypothetical protein